jgi:hypothetical protein
MPRLLMVLLSVALLGGEDAALDTAVAAAREAIRSRLGATDSRIHVVEAVATRWANASLGCPEKGMSYAQVLTEGHQVRLRVEDRTFDVRVANGRTVVCGLGTATPGAEADAAATTRLYRAARRDLAKRLGVSEKEIRVDFIRPTTWPEGAPDCLRAPDRAVAPARGLTIQLEAGGKTHTYLSDMDQVRPCEPPRP